MTQQEAIKEQQLIKIKGFNLGWWYYDRGEKCCGVYPRLIHKNTNDKYHDTAYRCEVCGKQTPYFGMPWEAREAWDKHEYLGEGVQMSFL